MKYCLALLWLQATESIRKINIFKKVPQNILYGKRTVIKAPFSPLFLSASNNNNKT